MACIIPDTAPTIKIKLNPFAKHPVSRSQYEIPERYRNSFYWANASFFDSANWFLHRALEFGFPGLVEKTKKACPEGGSGDVDGTVRGVIEVMDQCNSIVDVRFPIKRDNGKFEVVRGFRAQYGLASGYKGCLGGLRINDNITRDHMKGLSVLSAYRNACMGIGLAGAHGGIKINPQDYSKSELQQILEKYAAELIQKGYCGEKDVLQPDMNCSQQEMGWISQGFAKVTGQDFNVAAVGKPEKLGGFKNYSITSSLGAFMALEFFLNNALLMEKIGIVTGLKDKTFIIQGLGKLGKPLAELLVSHGATCVAVRDPDAYVYDPKGIDLQKLFEHRTNTGSVKDFAALREGEDDRVFQEECDILVLAACHKSLVCYIADNVKAKIVLEAADGAVTPTAHRILTGKGKLVIPDIYGCSAATVTSYLEYLKNLHEIKKVNEETLRFSNKIYDHALAGMIGDRKQTTIGGSVFQIYENASVSNIVEDTLESVLTDVGKNMVEILDVQNLGTDLRMAAFLIAIDNIFSAILSLKTFT